MRAEAVVIGGGLAGAAAAITLARGGREVLLVEREANPQHKVCGEFLSGEAVAYLAALEVDVRALGGVAIDRVRLAGSGRVSEGALPFTAMSLTRRCLDEEMLRLAEAAGAKVVRGCTVEGLAGNHVGESGNGAPHCWVKLSSGEEVEAGAVFLATGKHDLRGRARPAGRQNDLVAWKMYWRLAAAQAEALRGHVELVLYRGGYAGLQMVEGGAANLCCLVRREELKRLGGRWEGLLEAMRSQCPHLRERLEGAEPLLEKALAVAAIPYGMVREQTDGVWCVGDQAAVIPSFTGDGMSIALHSGMLAGQIYLAGQSAAEFQRTLHGQMSRQVGLATALSRGLVAWPEGMSAVARFWPGVLRVVAKGTRISDRRMLV